MSLKKAVVSTFVGGLFAGVAASASAQQVESQKSAAASLLPNAYGSIDLRQYSFKELNEGAGDKNSPAIQSRLIVGSTFMDGKLDIDGVFAVTAKPQTEKYNQRNPQFDAKYAAVEGTYGEISPILTVYSAHQGSPLQAYPDLYAQVKYPIELSIGTLTPALSGEWNARFMSAQTDAKVYNESSKTTQELGLTEDKDKDPVRPQQDLNYAAEYVASIALSAGKFGVTLYQFMDQLYYPRYTANDEDGTLETSRPVKTSVTEGLKVSYKITDKATLSNEVYSQQGGVYETQFEGYDDNKGLPAFSNIAKITYKL